MTYTIYTYSIYCTNIFHVINKTRNTKIFYKKLLFQSLYFQIKFDKCIKRNIHIKLHLSK